MSVSMTTQVVIFGDGKSNPITMAGDKLNDSRAVVGVGEGVALPAPVRDTHKALSNKIYRCSLSGRGIIEEAVHVYNACTCSIKLVHVYIVILVAKYMAQ